MVEKSYGQDENKNANAAAKTKGVIFKIIDNQQYSDML